MPTARTNASPPDLSTHVRRASIGALRHRWVLAVLLGGVASIISWNRLTPVTRGTLWAEDGRTFLHTAAVVPLFEAVARPYAGYLHTVPRLIASWVVFTTPIEGWAQAMTAYSCLIAGFVAVTVFVFAHPVIPSIPLRAALAGVGILAPALPREVLGNVANLHSLFLWLATWLVLGRARSRRVAVLGGVAALLAAATEIQCLFLLPVVPCALRDPRRRPIGAGLLIGGALQIAATVLAPRSRDPKALPDPASFGLGLLINSSVTTWVPAAAVGAVVAHGGVLVCIAALLPAIVAAAVVLRRGATAHRRTLLAVASVAVVVYVASVITNPHPFYDYGQQSADELRHLWLTRYGVVPQMMMLAVIPLAVQVEISFPRPSRSRKPLVVALTFLFVVSFVVNFAPVQTRRSSGPVWSPQVEQAEFTCDLYRWRPSVQLRQTLGWSVQVPCALLRA